MREILFRGKDAIDGKWIYGDVIHRHRYNDYVGIDRYVGGQFGYAIAKVKNESVSQYTGLTDKNGTRIFEGDVLSGHLDDLFTKDESRYEVVWYDYGWHIKSGNGFFDTMEQNWVNMLLEVIGNIYDNPELLEVEEHE